MALFYYLIKIPYHIGNLKEFRLLDILFQFCLRALVYWKKPILMMNNGSSFKKDFWSILNKLFQFKLVFIVISSEATFTLNKSFNVLQKSVISSTPGWISITTKRELYFFSNWSDFFLYEPICTNFFKILEDRFYVFIQQFSINGISI